MNLTSLTAMIGDTIAKIKNNNKLIDELNKRYNPTFLEIMEDIKDTDKTLANLLMLWYIDRYSVDTSKLEKVLDDIRKEYGIKEKVKTKTKTVYTSIGGGCTDNDYDYSGGCGGSSSSRKRSYSGGCGCSCSNDSHC